MQPPTVREAIRMLEADGFMLARTAGDHRRYVKGACRVTVSGKMGDHVKPGTWASIQRQAGWR